MNWEYRAIRAQIFISPPVISVIPMARIARKNAISQSPWNHISYFSMDSPSNVAKLSVKSWTLTMKLLPPPSAWMGQIRSLSVSKSSQTLAKMCARWKKYHTTVNHGSASKTVRDRDWDSPRSTVLMMFVCWEALRLRAKAENARIVSNFKFFHNIRTNNTYLGISFLCSTVLEKVHLEALSSNCIALMTHSIIASPTFPAKKTSNSY